MKKTSILVLLAALAMGTVTTVSFTASAQAAATTPGGGGGGTPTIPGGGNGGGGNGGGGGGGNGGGGTPVVPEIPENPGGGNGSTPSDDDLPTQGEFGNPGEGGIASILAQPCGDKLGGLRMVRQSDIAAVAADSMIQIVPICRNRPLSDTQNNVEGLYSAIDANAVLRGELGQSGFGSNEVVGVIVNGQSVVLYVHRKG